MRQRPSQIFDCTFFYKMNFGLINSCDDAENLRNRKILTTQNLSTLGNHFCHISLTNFHLNSLMKFCGFCEFLFRERYFINKDLGKRGLSPNISRILFREI